MVAIPEDSQLWPSGVNTSTSKTSQPAQILLSCTKTNQKKKKKDLSHASDLSSLYEIKVRNKQRNVVASDSFHETEILHAVPLAECITETQNNTLHQH